MIPIFSASVVNANLDLQSSIKRVLDRHWYVLGEEVKSFELEFAEYVGVAECVSLANGTDALELALRGVGIAAGDKVVSVANAGFYGSTAIHSIGAIPLYVDVEATSLTMDVDALSQALQHKPKAVIVTHLYGQMANVEKLIHLARDAGVAVIEDCAQSNGAALGGRRSGSFGDIGCFSFYPTKNLGALGDGGAIVCNDPVIASKVRTLRQYGWSTKYQVDNAHGRNSRLDEMQAAILRDKLPLLDGWNAERRRIATQYNNAFADLPLVLPPSIGEDYVAHLYVIRVKARDAFRQHMTAGGVATDIHYPIPDHHQRAYPHAITVDRLPNTEIVRQSVVTLPCFPGLTDRDVAIVIAAVRSFFKR